MATIKTRTARIAKTEDAQEDTKTSTPPPVKYLVIIRGKGTAHETRISTTIPLYWCARANAYVTIPQD
jgi:hypothetical protein